MVERKKNGATLESYTYDLNGNRTSYTHSAPNSFSLTASYDAQDRIVQQGDASYTFDADGYLTRGLFADSCQYSARGELLSAAAWGQNINYTYDGIGRRVARTDHSGTYQYFYANLGQPFQVSAVRDPAGVFTAFYYDASGGLFAFKRGASTYYVASDHLGTPRVVTDAAGTVVRTMEYDSYGFVQSDSNPSFDLVIGFAGGIPDTTGLIRFGYRDYEPGSGRWVSRDPILFQSGQANLYQYVQNNPVNWTDPFGLAQAMPVPGGLPIFIPPGSVFEPGSRANDVFVGSTMELIKLFDPRPLADWIYKKIPKPGSKPKGCPTGTKPIDQVPELDRDKIHGIKNGVGAGPRDWTGITPDGDVITGDANGDAVNHGPYDSYLP